MANRSIELTIADMHCTTCAISIEKVLQKQPGVSLVSVNYANNQARIEFDKKKNSEAKLIEAIEKTGYKIVPIVLNIPVMMF